MTKLKKIIIFIFMILLITATVVSSLVGLFFYNLAINANYSKDIVYADYNNENLRDDEKWLEEESNYTEDYIKSFDNLNLHSYIVNQTYDTNKWAIVVHGYAGSGMLMSSKAKYFYDMGYNVLIPDLRGHGKSEGEYIGMGLNDRLDIISWINFIIKNNSESEIVLHGTSMGAATVLMASGENLPSNVKAIISDCAYTSAWDEFSYELENYLNVPASYILNITNLVTKLKAGYSFKEASALDAVKKSTVPILYIHGTSDKFVPYSMMDKLYNATNSPKKKLSVEGAEHGNSHLIAPYLYWLTINDFLQQYID